ncbi:thiolase domain-containing protein, partial [Candidatus Curtissbacteria bacterium]|nr:thiolase domain-containing protein [Candidatus Curtissbacteria bacterium]
MRVAIAGTAVTQFGELWEESFYTLAKRAASVALSKSRIHPQKIDAIFVANMLSGSLLGQNHLGAQVASL